MAQLTAQPPLMGGGDMSIDIQVGILNADTFDKGAVKLSVDPVDPLNPIAWGKNDGSVEVTSNKVTGFSGPTDQQYPSALLVSNLLATKPNKQSIVAGTGTKITYNTDGLVVVGDFATTADIGESTDKRYVTEVQHAAILGLSGTNTGDQDLSVYALQTSLNATNTAVSNLASSLSNYTLETDFIALSNQVDGISTSLSQYALVTDLAAANARIDATNANLSSNYTPLTTHNALQNDFNNLVLSMNDPSHVDSTAYESKLTFASGLTRVEDTITNDAMTNVVGPGKFLGNGLGVDGVPSFVTIAAEFLGNGVTGAGRVVLDTTPTIGAPVLLAPATVLLADSNVSTSPSILVVEHDFVGGGSIVPGFGATLEFRGRSSNTSHRTQGAIRTVWSTATDGSRTSNIVLSPVIAAVTTDVMWIHGDGSVAIGANVGSGSGLLHAAGGFSTTGVGVAGQTLIDNGTKFVPGKLDASYLSGQFASCPIVDRTTQDQIVTTETSHLTVPVAAGSTAGTVWRVVAWGNMDHGSSSVNFQSFLRWGGMSGTVIAQSQVIATPGSIQTNQAWEITYLVMITAVGSLGTARASCHCIENMTPSNNVQNSGGTDVTPVNTTIITTMEMTWTISGTSGAPHVRTFGAFAELVSRPIPASS